MSTVKTAVRLTSEQKAQLDCICGLCNHDCMDKTCLYNKIIDKMNPEQAQEDAIIAWMNGIVNEIVGKISRDIIKKKKG